MRLQEAASKIKVAATVFVRRRDAFLLAIAISAIVRLLLSAVVPPSYDLRDMVNVVPPSPVLGPWMALEVQIFQAWQSVTSQTITALQWSMTPLPDMSANLRLLSLLLRLPAIVFDFATGILLYFAVARLGSTSNARLACLLWFLNPYTLFASDLLGVPDVAAAFLTLCTVVSLLNRRVKFASIFFALSVALKLYPILLLPPLLVYISRRMAAKTSAIGLMFVAAVLGLVGYVSWAYPNWIPNVFLFEYTPVTQTLSLYIPYQLREVRVSAATIFLVLLYFVMWRFSETQNLTDLVLPVLLVYFTFSYLYPQYLVWALPFLTLDVVLVNRRRVLLLVLLLVLVFTYWFFSSTGLPTPSGYSMLMFPVAGKNLPPLSQSLVSFLNSDIIGVLFLPILESSVYGLTLVYALEIMRGWFGRVQSRLG